MNDFVTGLLIVGVFANLGFLIVIARRLRKLIDEFKDIYHQVFNVEEDTNYAIKDVGLMLREMSDKIPDTFEYNGNKGKVYKK